MNWVLFALAVLLAQAVVASNWSDVLSGVALVAVGVVAVARAARDGGRGDAARRGETGRRDSRATGEQAAGAPHAWRRWRSLAVAALLVAAAGALARTTDPCTSAALSSPPRSDAADTVRVESLLDGQLSTDAGYNIRGRVIDVAPSSTGGMRLAIAVEDIARDREAPRAASGIVALSIRYATTRWHTGDRAGFRSRLRRLTSYGNFGEFDWAAYNARRGIFVSAYAWKESDVERLGGQRGVVDRVRLALSLACDEVGGQGAAILEALTTGDRFSLTPATALALRDAGLSHFLAISGSHMVLVAALAVGLLRWTLGRSASLLASYDVMRPAALGGAVAVVAYAAITGGGVSVARSVLMALASLVALWRGRPGDDLRALGGSAVVLAVALPGVGEEAGFQLSFAAVAVLIAYGRNRRRVGAEAARPAQRQVGVTRREQRQVGVTRSRRDRAAAIERDADAESGSRDGAGAQPEDLASRDLDTPCGPHPGDVASRDLTPRVGSRESAGAQPEDLASRDLDPPCGPHPGDVASRDLTPRVVASRDLTPFLWVVEAIRITVVCCAVTSPIVAQHFHRVSVVAPLSNLLAAPLVSAIVVVGLAALVIEPLWPAGQHLLVWVGARLGDALVFVATSAASLPYASVAVPAPGPVLTVVLASAVFVLLLTQGTRRAVALAGLGAAAALCLALGLHDRFRDDRLDAWFPSVGQGDAALLRLPGGKVGVIDAGPEGRGRMVMEPLLRRLWIGRIDVLVASHLQFDHAGAFPELLDSFEVGEMWIPDGACQGPVAAAVLAKARDHHVPVRRLRAGAAPQFLSTGAAQDPTRGATLEILGPAGDSGACDGNDQSLVVAAAFAGRRLLFTGDIEAPGEEALMRAGAALRADLLKVPHHGSRTSSTPLFLDAVAPSLAVASLGLENHYGFPDRDVEQRYLARGLRWLRTDRAGAVHVMVDASGLRVVTARACAQP